MKRYRARPSSHRKRKNGNIVAFTRSLDTLAWLLGGPKPKHLRRKKKKWF